MKISRNQIKKIRKAAKKALKSQRRAVRRANAATYMAVDLDDPNDKTKATMVEILEHKIKNFRFPPLRSERLENDAEPTE